MIERHGNMRTLLCDACDDVFDQVERHEFTSMVASARDEGWVIKPKGDGEWAHTCPTCSAPPVSRLEQQRRLFTR